VTAFDDPDEIGRIECPGCENSLSSILAAFREGGPCPECGLPAAAARQVLDARRKGAEESLTKAYTQMLKRAVDAEGERDDLRARLLEMREVANRPL
jgi:hypothetical protein